MHNRVALKESHPEQCTTHTHTNTDLIKYAATPPNQPQRCTEWPTGAWYV